MQLKPRVRRLRKQEKGATIALVVVAMVALLGMAAVSIDYATGVQNRQKAQDAADAAAMAVGNACAVGTAAQCTAAYAQDYATRNAPGSTVTVTPATLAGSAGTVTVKVASKSKRGFANAAFGKKDLTVSASATATWNGVVKEYLPAYPIAMEYCQWKTVGNLGGSADYKFGQIPTELTFSPHSTCLDPEDGKKLLVGPKPGRAVVMTGNDWWPTWDASKCKVPNKISVWQNLGKNMIGALFTTNAACKTLFATLKPEQTILVPLYTHRLRCTSFMIGSTCIGLYATDYIKIVGFVPFRIGPGKPFYDATGAGGAPSATCDLEAVASIFGGWLQYGCNRITGSFVKTTQIFPDATYGTVTGHDPIKAALSLKLTK